MNKSKFKGIILAGGKGTRLYPLTKAVNKQLLPVYDKPLIYYPLSMLMEIGVKEILLIHDADSGGHFQKCLGDGSQWGVSISYAVQKVAKGIPDALLIGGKFIGGDDIVLALGDNIFYPIDKLVEAARSFKGGATVFGFSVPNPSDYGIAEIDSVGKVINLEEKPKAPKSDLAVTGLYLFDKRSIHFAKGLHPSARGELEIVDILRHYLKLGELDLVQLAKPSLSNRLSLCLWRDAGTEESLMETSRLIAELEKSTGKIIGCPEIAAFKMGYISLGQLSALGEAMPEGGYRQRLWGIINSAKNKGEK